METKTLAFVVDGEVVSIMNHDERTAAILLSNPTIVDITAASITTAWNYSKEKGFYIEIDGEEIIVPA